MCQSCKITFMLLLGTATFLFIIRCNFTFGFSGPVLSVRGLKQRYEWITFTPVNCDPRSSLGTKWMIYPVIRQSPLSFLRERKMSRREHAERVVYKVRRRESAISVGGPTAAWTPSWVLHFLPYLTGSVHL